MNTLLSVKYQTRIIDAKTNKVVKQSPESKNLVLDTALNSLAQSSAGVGASDPATCFQSCKVGSGNNPNRFQGGLVTFTQVTTTLTASAPFFTAGMVGGIFKYGTDTTGVEYYITGFTSSTIVTVDTSATVAVAAAGTVWMVQQTTLQTQSFQTTTYQTNSGDNQTTYASNAMSLKRTFVFPVQASPYTVNEIGWSPAAGTAVLGRAVLSSSDVVGPTNFYVVVFTLTFTVGPAVPTANSNFGTGINTAGTTMVEMFSWRAVNSSGVAANSANGQGYALDGLVLGPIVEFWLNDWAQNSAITSNGTAPALPAGRIQLNGANWAYSGARGTMTLTATLSTTTTGQTCYGIGMHAQVSPFNIAFDCHFTTPQTLPTGSFTPTVVIQSVYNRVLDNA